ncbi:MAG: ROK family protein [Isosphaeraceae bacterium]|nr:ROK family protein [Isosphaeraceae bacterium]
MAGPGNGPLVVGVDLGGTKIVAGVIDAHHTIIGRAKKSTPAQEGQQAILEAIAACIAEALDVAGVGPAEVIGIGVGSPGPLDAEGGVILYSANMEVRDFALGPGLSRLFDRPVLVQNDVRVGGYGEFRLGAGRGYRDVLAAFVGTGIGGCLILGGQIVAGATGNAGEIGHITLKAGGPECGCGRRGCLEALASRTAIARRIQKAVRKGVSTSLRPKIDAKSDKLKSKDLAAAFAAGDALTIKEVRRAAHFLGLGLGSLVNVLGPEIVILGGGVTEALGPPYVDLVRESARRQIMADPERRVKIEPAALGDDAGILGAALMARERFTIG